MGYECASARRGARDAAVGAIASRRWGYIDQRRGDRDRAVESIDRRKDVLNEKEGLSGVCDTSVVFKAPRACVPSACFFLLLVCETCFAQSVGLFFRNLGKTDLQPDFSFRVPSAQVKVGIACMKSGCCLILRILPHRLEALTADIITDDPMNCGRNGWPSEAEGHALRQPALEREGTVGVA